MAFNISWTDVFEDADRIDFFDSYKLLPSKPFQTEEQTDITDVEHMFINGDNYSALRLIQSEYENKINLIYIDPPYNTGKKTFAYDDAFSDDSWLSFMSRRLKIAKKLLCEDGCIFISIGQEQLYKLKLLCDSIFGEENFINNFMWLHGKGKKDNFSRTMQQETLCYAKDIKKLRPFVDYEITSWAKANIDNDERGSWFSGSISFSEKRSNPTHPNYYEVISPSGIKWKRQWLISKEEMDALLRENKIYWGKAPFYANVPREKIFNGKRTPIIPKNIIDSIESTRAAQNYLDELLEEKKSFDNPKPVELIQHFIRITNMGRDIVVLDFFAGSGTTLEAVIRQNKEDGGKRKCILIQKPEIIQNKNSKFQNISELCLYRIKKIIPSSDRIKIYDVVSYIGAPSVR